MIKTFNNKRGRVRAKCVEYHVYYIYIVDSCTSFAEAGFSFPPVSPQPVDPLRSLLWPMRFLRDAFLGKRWGRELCSNDDDDEDDSRKRDGRYVRRDKPHNLGDWLIDEPWVETGDSLEKRSV